MWSSSVCSCCGEKTVGGCPWCTSPIRESSLLPRGVCELLPLAPCCRVGRRLLPTCRVRSACLLGLWVPQSCTLDSSGCPLYIEALGLILLFHLCCWWVPLPGWVLPRRCTYPSWCPCQFHELSPNGLPLPVLCSAGVCTPSSRVVVVDRHVPRLVFRSGVVVQA